VIRRQQAHTGLPKHEQYPGPVKNKDMDWSVCTSRGRDLTPLVLQILVEQGKHPVVQPVMLTRPASPSHPDHGQKDGEEDEEDWQQLSALPSSASGYLDKERAAGVGPAMYVDRGVEAGEPMSFRELFLRSNALESIIAGTLPCQSS
jgi:hypothetical protein